MKHPHVEEIHAWADGKKIEKFLGCTTKGAPVWRDDKNPSWDLDSEYRVKTETKVVDMSVLIESGIDCEFWDDADQKFPVIGKLLKINEIYTSYKYVDEDKTDYKNCRPRMNHVHAWQGGECPLPEGLVYTVCIPQPAWDGTALRLEWFECTPTSLCNQWNKVIAFEVVGLADGYCWHWECE